MRALIVIHDEMNGPGTLLGLLQEMGAETWIARLYDGDRLPADPFEYDAYFLMGGDMCANDVENFPFLAAEAEFISRAVEAGLPFLGVCFGAQMIAKACGGSVRRSPVVELGFSEISLTDVGRQDPLFAELPNTMAVFQWHQDTFEPPPEAGLLAKSFACPRQVFRYHNAYGVQHHPEVNHKILSGWFANNHDKYYHLYRMGELEPELGKQARKLFQNFCGFAARAKAFARGEDDSVGLKGDRNIIYLFKPK